jgi:hypothetical protein
MAGYSGTPLVKKLGIKPGDSLYIFNAPERYFDWLFPVPEETSIHDKLKKELDFIHLFVDTQKAFKSTFTKSKKHLAKRGMMWVSWPKKSSNVPTDLDENIIRDYGLKEGLVDVKVCAVNEIWSALKFVYRLQDR